MKDLDKLMRFALEALILTWDDPVPEDKSTFELRFSKTGDDERDNWRFEIRDVNDEVAYEKENHDFSALLDEIEDDFRGRLERHRSVIDGLLAEVDGKAPQLVPPSPPKPDDIPF